MIILKPLSSIIDNTGKPFEGNVKPLIGFSLPNERDIPKYLFRYMSFQSFTYMFYLRQILFRSAVTSNDVNECQYPYGELFHKIKDAGNPLSFFDYYSLISLERGRYFISCWAGSNDPYPKETMRHYFSKDGVVVAFDGKKLIEAFKSNIVFRHTRKKYPRDSLSNWNNLQLYSHGSVIYYDKNEIRNDLNSGLEIPHPAFAKTKEFELENEYRFVIDIGERLLDFNILNKSNNTGLKFDGADQSIFAHPADNKSLNDIGLISVISCSDLTDIALLPLHLLREAKFESLTKPNEEFIFRQTKEKAINIMSWDTAINNGII